MAFELCELLKELKVLKVKEVLPVMDMLGLPDAVHGLGGDGCAIAQ
ncbi:hypothetical protein [Mucilaginibacter sp.]|nr:hypothetical protein [Mucilaginibacter sp.]MDB5031184.1 hypothetical protein [Mucilaginibacter sp.]